MRILVIADFNRLCGARTYFEMLIKKLRNRNFDVYAFISFPPDDTRFSEFAAKNDFHWEVMPERKGVFKRAFFSQIWELFHLCKLIIRHCPDMIIVSTRTPGDWLTPFLLPLPVIHVLHTVVSKVGRWKRIPIRFMLSCISQKHRLVTVSSFAAQQIALHWGCEATFTLNPTTFPNAVKNPVKRKGMLILTVGGVFEYKNPHVWLNVALRVLMRHPDASFAWYGDGPLLETMRSMSKGIPNIQFCGSSSDLQSVYADAALYFHPSTLESHGIAPLEAMSFGLPCVVSNSGGLPESIIHDVTGYVAQADDSQAFVDKICFLLEHPDIAAQFGVNGQQRIVEHFLPARWEADFFSLFESCMSSKRFD